MGTIDEDEQKSFERRDLSGNLSSSSSSSGSTISIVNACQPGDTDSDDEMSTPAEPEAESQKLESLQAERSEPKASNKISFAATTTTTNQQLSRTKSSICQQQQESPPSVRQQQYRHHSFQSRHLINRNRSLKKPVEGQQHQQQQRNSSISIPQADFSCSLSPKSSYSFASASAHSSCPLQATRSSSLCRHRYHFSGGGVGNEQQPLQSEGVFAAASGQQQAGSNNNNESAGGSQSLSARRLTGAQSLRLKLIATSWLASLH